MTHSHEEFICQGCGEIIVSPIPTHRTKCLICLFIDEIPDPKDRADVRARLYDSEQMRFWAGHDAYVDTTCEERRCDHCRKLYRGPAVYCSLRCAIAGA